MDHTEDPHKSNERQKSPAVIRDRDESVHDRDDSGASDYYYDDSTNYEIYRDDENDPAEPERDC
jgi:hypothetical protein